MNRLTKTYKDGTYGIVNDLPRAETSYTFERLLIDALGKYEDLEEQGRLIKLPCKVGDTVWKIKATFSYFTRPIEDRVDRIIITSSETLVCCTSGRKFGVDEMGELVFLTSAEAESKLKEIRESEEKC